MGLFAEPRIYADCPDCERRFWIETGEVPLELFCPYCGGERRVKSMEVG